MSLHPSETGGRRSRIGGMPRGGLRRGRAVLMALAIASGLLPAAPFVAPVFAATLPSGFSEAVAWGGLTNPTVLQFASDGKVFVAEKSGLVKVFDDLNDTSATVFADLRTNVYNFWDRGLLGMVLDPGFPTRPYVYVLYSYDHILGDDPLHVPRWGAAGATGDPCPSNPGPTTDGCVISARLSRLAMGAGGTWDGQEQVLVEDWCQQFPSHSIGTLAFGPEGALYASGGDGANFNTTDYGQLGGTQLTGTPPAPITQANPCGDPPSPAGTPLSGRTAEGGALRSQDLRTTGVVGGADYRTTILGAGPVAYWRLGETSGTNAVELVAARNGTYVAGPTLGVAGGLTGDTDKAIRLDGVDDRVSVPDADVFSLARTGQLSIEFWAKPATDSGSGGIFIAKGTAANYEYAIDRDGSGFHAVVWNGAGNVRTSIFTPGNWSGATWHQVVVTLQDNVALKIYVDGGLAASNTTWQYTSPNGTSPFEIGRRPDNQGYYRGDIDDVAVYDRVLSAAEITAHHDVGLTGNGGGSGNTDPTGLDGTIIRIDPATGLAWPGNPTSGPDENARRIIAHGMRNPFRFTFRPGTSELWVGDVGYSTWEEVDRIQSPAAPVENLGWPCYEGVGRQPGYDGLNVDICENLYNAGSGAVLSPYFTYNHSALVVPGETCPMGSSAVAGLAFYPASGGPYPATYGNALFFLDNSRDCIWAMRAGTNGLPDPNQISTFVAAAANPVDLKLGPGNLLYYVDFDGGTIRRIDYAGAGNQPPVAHVTANPTSGVAPLTVQFSGTTSTDPENGALTYAWDLDGDGLFNDGTASTASFTYQTSGTVTAVLRVTDPQNASDTDPVVITVGDPNQPPVPVIDTPLANTMWTANQDLTFSGHATDPEDGTVPASRLSWSLVLQHCPSNCHTHPLTTWDGVASGTLTAPDHDYPSYLELTLTATDSAGRTASVTRRLDPRTVVLSFATAPSGLSLSVDATAQATPFTRTVIVGSGHTISGTSPQTLNGAGYVWSSWSDGGVRVHTINAPATATTYTATYTVTTRTFTPLADAEIRQNKASTNYGTLTSMRVRTGNAAYRSYLMFDITGLTGTPTNAKLRLWVTDAAAVARNLYLIPTTTWTETGITWNNAPALPGSTYRTIAATATGVWVEVDLGTLVTGNGRYAFAIAGGSTDIAGFQTREAANDPQLVLTVP